MAPHRWSSRTAVRKEDQFTAAPDFIDQHDSDHMPMWGRLGASWHGMAPQRQVLVASSILVIAGALGALALFTIADLSGGSTGSSSQDLAAKPGGDPAAPLGQADDQVSGLLNTTRPVPSPTLGPSP
ncbi:MAG: hypothetical protein QOC71_1056 [Thermoplasmata archaeon]|jgi:hypothetical protein|nr:hypothetical protein [Thermoplasmata archaeon]